MSVSMVASPRFEPANLSRTESGEERLALHKNHDGRAQAVRAMGGYGMTASGAKRSFVKSRLQLSGMNGHASLREWARPSVALLGRSSSSRRPDVVALQSAARSPSLRG